MFNSDYGTVVEFIISGTLPPIKNISDIGALKKLSEEVLTNPYDKVIFRIESLPIETVPTLKNITADEVKVLGVRFNNFRFLSAPYDIKMGEIPASKTQYLYKDKGTQKQGMQVNALYGYKQITMEYSSIPQDFDKFLPMIYKMINSFRLTSY